MRNFNTEFSYLGREIVVYIEITSKTESGNREGISTLLTSYWFSTISKTLVFRQDIMRMTRNTTRSSEGNSLLSFNLSLAFGNWNLRPVNFLFLFIVAVCSSMLLFGEGFSGILQALDAIPFDFDLLICD